VLALLIAAAAAGPALAEADPGVVVDAEKAFAADGLAMGIKRSFQKHAAPDAIVLAPDPVDAQSNLAREEDDAGGPPLAWWPRWAGIARSGDLGFTTGPYTYDGEPKGWYFTVWARQADGSWKWIFDGGVRADPRQEPGPLSHAEYLQMSGAEAGSAAAAMAEVSAAEADLARRAQESTRIAYLRHLAEDGRLTGSSAPPATGRAAFELELQARPRTLALSPLGGRASAAGDLAFAYGDARWSGGRGHYVRIWQKRAPGWRLVYDELVPVTSPASD